MSANIDALFAAAAERVVTGLIAGGAARYIRDRDCPILVHQSETTESIIQRLQLAIEEEQRAKWPSRLRLIALRQALEAEGRTIDA